jgi:DNA-binding XRE family transcriptional regulator
VFSDDQLAELRGSASGPNRLKMAMALAGLTQVQLAEAIGATQSHVSEIANGNYTQLPLETARTIARQFGCSIEDLFPAREQVA